MIASEEPQYITITAALLLALRLFTPKPRPIRLKFCTGFSAITR